MPRKQVYGKRATAISFSSRFTTFSSPAQPVVQTVTEHEDEDVVEVTRKIKELTVEKKNREDLEVRRENEAVQAKQRIPKKCVRGKGNVLAPRDANACAVQRKGTKQEGGKKSVSSAEEKCPSQVVAVLPAEPRRAVDAELEQQCVLGSREEKTPQRPRMVPKSPATSNRAPSYMSPTVQSSAKALSPGTTLRSGTTSKSSPQTRSTHQRQTVLPCRSHPIPSQDHYTSYALPLLSLCSDPIGSSQPTDFQSWADSLSQFFRVSKIAEASYGEVYRLSLLSPKPGFARSDESVLKIIALKPPSSATAKLTCQDTKARAALEKKVAFMSAVDDVAGEVQLLQRMSPIPGFTNFREIRVMKGRLPKQFVAAWRAFNKTAKEKSVFPDPGRKASYQEDQLWAVIEMQDAGTDLENIVVDNVWLCWDIFWSVAMTVGKGEELAKFESRDLHLGNICIRSSDPGKPFAGSVSPILRPGQKTNFLGVETTIIDYTISRAEMADLDRSGDQERRIAYFDLENDPAIFEGDASEEYQYEIYRYMRGALYFDDPLADVSRRWTEAKATGRTWKGYHPQTNLVWLHFLLHKLTEHLAWPSDSPGTYKKARETGIEVDHLLVATRLQGTIKRLQGLLDPAAFQKSGLRSAKDLLALALHEGWLEEDDVVGYSAAPQPRKTMTGISKKGRPRRKR